MGTGGERVSRRQTLAATVGAALFAGGALIAAISPNVQVLIAGIAVSGVGGALLMPSSMSI